MRKRNGTSLFGSLGTHTVTDVSTRLMLAASPKSLGGQSPQDHIWPSI